MLYAYNKLLELCESTILFNKIIISILGNCYILTISDYFTKWVEAVATPDKSAVQVASSLFKVSTIIYMLTHSHVRESYVSSCLRQVFLQLFISNCACTHA